MRSRLFKTGFQQGAAPHEFLWSEEVRIDLIPFGPGLIEQDRLTWPGTGIVIEDRRRDLIDVVYCSEHYEEDLEGSRRFNVAVTAVDERPVQYEEAGAFLLGFEVAKLAKAKSLVAVRKFLDRIPDEYARPISQILYEEQRIADNGGRRRELFRLFRVFAAGLNAGS